MSDKTLINRLEMADEWARPIDDASPSLYSNAVGEINRLTAANEALREEVERLQRELNHQRLIHVGFTNNTQIEGAKQSAGSFYPSTENDNWIPVYMLVKHAHRCGRDSETFCRLLELEQENKVLHSEIEMRKLQVTGAAKVIQEEKNDNSKLREERDQLKARVTDLYMLLDEHFVEWEKDSGNWDEFEWHDRVSVALAKDLSVLAAHDAEVIERFKYVLFNEGRIRTCITKGDFDIIANQIRQQAEGESK